MNTQNFHFTKDQRLLTPTDFKHVFDSPMKKIHGDHCIVFVKHNDKNTPRLGLAITKKKLKQAVMRNKVKRVTREIFRLNQHEIADVDLVLIVKIGFTKDFDIMSDIVKIFEKIKHHYPKSSQS
ncbi:ribonuclease P protein component [Moraxella sp.]|uniref:ribonuclease P protein component n=1 Tax=Moraxella sp. TaxID=479 RepID=UPI0026165F43|nr:ribonuclease P protein component [Moraxella sp.]MCP3897080.1 ribonuclease P protein component [Moraxella sp.]